MAARVPRRRWRQRVRRTKLRVGAAFHHRFRHRRRPIRTGSAGKGVLVTWGMPFFMSALLIGAYAAAQGLNLPRVTVVALGHVVAMGDRVTDEGSGEPEAVPAFSRAFVKDVLPLYGELGPERTPRVSWKERLRRAAEWAVGWVPGGSTSALASTLPYLSRQLPTAPPTSTSPYAAPVVPEPEPHRAAQSALDPIANGADTAVDPPPSRSTEDERSPQLGVPAPQTRPAEEAAVSELPVAELNGRAPTGPEDSPPDRAAPDRPSAVPDRSPSITVPDRIPAPMQRTGPLVLVYHTHTSEMYRTDAFSPEDPDEYHRWNTTDTGVVKVGARLVETLRDQYRIPAIQSKTIHDYPVHAYAYAQSEKTVRAMLEQYPSIRVVIDLHRDGVESPLTVTVDGEETAQVALVLATATSSRLPHPEWERNEAFAELFKDRIQALYPDMDRRMIRVDTARYNQQVHPHSILIEVGSYSTALDAALRTADRLAEVLAALITELPPLGETD